MEKYYNELEGKALCLYAMYFCFTERWTTTKRIENKPAESLFFWFHQILMAVDESEFACLAT